MLSFQFQQLQLALCTVQSAPSIISNKLNILQDVIKSVLSFSEQDLGTRTSATVCNVCCNAGISIISFISCAAFEIFYGLGHHWWIVQGWKISIEFKISDRKLRNSFIITNSHANK